MTARLVITNPAPMRGTSLVLSGERMVIGRGVSSDLRIDDAFVSQCHAAVMRQGPRTVLEDLGSRNGTSVNGQTVSSPRALRHGDVIGFGRVEIRFEEAAVHERWDGTRQFDPIRDDGRGQAANYVIDRQRAEVLNNVGRDQYFQQVIHQRDGFLREIAATKTHARRLIWLGVVFMVLGAAAFASMVIGFISKGFNAGANPEDIDPAELAGPSIGGIPIGLIGWAVAAAGSLMIIIGIVLHVVATARRRRVEQAFAGSAPYPARHPR